MVILPGIRTCHVTIYGHSKLVLWGIGVLLALVHWTVTCGEWSRQVWEPFPVTCLMDRI